MAKKRKTREQKKLADLRHAFTHAKTFAATATYEVKQKLPNKIEAKTATASLNKYPYLKKDLSKTALITLIVLLFQVGLFFSLKAHIFEIPGLSY